MAVYLIEEALIRQHGAHFWAEEEKEVEDAKQKCRGIYLVCTANMIIIIIVFFVSNIVLSFCIFHSLFLNIFHFL